MNFESYKEEEEVVGGKQIKEEGVVERQVEQTQDKVRKIGQFFDELLDSEEIKNAPEAKKIVLDTYVAQFRQISEQLKNVRDIENLNEIKRLIIENWQKMKEIANGDERLLRFIQKWGDDFIDQKVLYYDLVSETRDELMRDTEDLDRIWSGTSLKLSELGGLLRMSSHDSIYKLLDGESETDLVRVKEDAEFRRSVNKGTEFLEAFAEARLHKEEEKRNKNTKLDFFISQIDNPENFYNGDGVDIENARLFISQLTNSLTDAQKLLEMFRPQLVALEPEKLARIESLITSISDDRDQISNIVRRISSTFSIIKKARDTHYLKTFNQQPIE